ncbi:MAG TPA: MBL fold metallo-hydrolase [Mariniphaga sp.]|nr:MBL fold metallo-hydrolase [Mariniphaga sp.]
MEQPPTVVRRIGYSNVSLIVNGKRSILVDTGVKGNLKKILRMFENYKLDPQDICLIILTHTHYDHTGNLKELKRLTGAPVLVHEMEYEYLKKGFMPIPNGQRIFMKLISMLGKLFVPWFASPEPFNADLVNKGEYDLTPYGFSGKVIHTPGHSIGSQSVLLGNKVIAGDCFMNMAYGVVFPHFAEKPTILLESWRKLFDLGIEEIIPGHGKLLKVDKAKRVFEKWKNKLNCK